MGKSDRIVGFTKKGFSQGTEIARMGTTGGLSMHLQRVPQLSRQWGPAQQSPPSSLA